MRDNSKKLEAIKESHALRREPENGEISDRDKLERGQAKIREQMRQHAGVNRNYQRQEPDD